MNKVLASDFDGTLKKGRSINKLNVKAIKQFQKDGNLFGIATGRTKAFINTELTSIGINIDFFIGCNGAIIEYKDFRHYEYMDKSLADQIVKESVNDSIVINYKHLDFISSVRNKKMLLHPMSLLLSVMYKTRKHKPTYNNILGLTIVCKNEEKVKIIKKRLIDKYKDTYDITGQRNWIDVSPLTARKDIGYKKLQEVLGYKSSQMYAVGDAENDYTLLEYFNSFGIRSNNKIIEEKAKHMVDEVWEAIDYINEEENNSID